MAPTDQDSRNRKPPALRRDLGVFGAAMMGLGSIVGTGVFVSIGVAAGIAGPAVILAILIAAGVATLNALNSAQLAASHPVSGGTYEYGYKYLRPWLGFSAGWMFLCAKTASAATAALGFAGYLLTLLGFVDGGRLLLAGVAVLTVAVLTAIVSSGIRQSSRVNIAVVSVTLLSLLALVICGLPAAVRHGGENLRNFHGTGAADAFWPALLHATALMFVAYTGYGRIATLGEEVRDPRRTIPRAIIITLWASALLYAAVAIVSVSAVGADTLGSVTREQAAPLEVAARQLPPQGLHVLVAIGAMTAMLGVLLNLILGLSRVLLAMGRRGDMPAGVARLNATETTPYVAVGVVGVIVAGIALIGDVRTTWSFSAFTVLIYYALTNLTALALPTDERLYGRWLAWGGLAACAFLAFWVQWQIWALGLVLFAAGLMWHVLARRITRHARQ